MLIYFLPSGKSKQRNVSIPTSVKLAPKSKRRTAEYPVSILAHLAYSWHTLGSLLANPWLTLSSLDSHGSLGSLLAHLVHSWIALGSLGSPLAHSWLTLLIWLTLCSFLGSLLAHMAHSADLAHSWLTWFSWISLGSLLVSTHFGSLGSLG